MWGFLSRLRAVEQLKPHSQHLRARVAGDRDAPFIVGQFETNLPTALGFQARYSYLLKDSDLKETYGSPVKAPHFCRWGN